MVKLKLKKQIMIVSLQAFILVRIAVVVSQLKETLITTMVTVKYIFC